MAKPISADSVYCADFETTTAKNLERDGKVRVYLWSLVNIKTKISWHGYSIESFLDKIRALKCRVCYFHNLKFDGNFILAYCLEKNIEVEPLVDTRSKTFFELKIGICRFRDSLKKFPFSLNAIAVQVGLKPKLKPPNFDRYIPFDYIPSIDEIEYCVYDSMILSHVMEKEFVAGRTRLTASSETYQVAKSVKGYDVLFPSLSEDLDTFARRSYKGGFCYLNPRYQNLDLDNVYVYDVNSLYPYVMRDLPLPHGLPFPDDPKSNQFYVVKFYAEFELNEGFIPTIQIKGNYRYHGRETEYLTESDGVTELYMSKEDYELAHRHYDFYLEYGHEYQTYNVKTGVFKDIIDKNNALKEKATEEGDGFTRLISKLNNNMLYGAFGINPTRWSGSPYLDDEGVVTWNLDKTEIPSRYVPFASAVTSHARNITITSAQKNYEDFIYADTDSLHLLHPAKDINLDRKKLGCWKHEHPDGRDSYAKGKYLRQKGYAHADENYKIYESYDSYGNFLSEMKFSGVPDEAKKGFLWENLYEGYEIQGKLQHKVVKGGVCLTPTTYTL